MALPSINSPIYELTIPSTGKKVKYRPFLVKEEKALLLAQESEDVNVLIDTIKAIVASCTNGEANVDSLAVFDLEHILINIRAKSVGEIVELVFGCDVCKEDEKAKVKVNIDLTKIPLERHPDHNKVIPLFGEVGVTMKYPPVSLLKQLETSTNETESYYDIVIDCIDNIYEGEAIYVAKEQPHAELVEFINNLNREQFTKIQRFFETQPKLKQVVNYKCPVCDKEHTKTIEGLQSFF